MKGINCALFSGLWRRLQSINKETIIGVRAMKTYKSFAELAVPEREGISYHRTVKTRRSGFAILAPHGGGIEPGTSEIAHAIAGSLFSYYTFDGLKREGNAILHISTSFDEPKCLHLVHSSEIAIAIHGSAGDQKVINVGGLHEELKMRIIHALVEAGFDAHRAEAEYAGHQAQNICNRGRVGRGVQLEISEGLRRSMFKGFDRRGRKNSNYIFRKFVASVHAELASAAKELGLQSG
jgi:phage replication-related protein YjqB (UPF0714/DUF867 family)